MTGLEPHVQRVVKVRGRLLGTGYAVGDDLILTAGHVVGVRGEAARIARSDGPTEPEHRATVIWRGDGIDADAALLRLDVPLWTAEQTRTRYGELRGHQPVPCRTVGYPWVQFAPDGRRLDELPGQVMPSLGFEDHRYALDSTRIAPNPPQPQRDSSGALVRDDAGTPVLAPHPHSGFSGAPLLTAGERQLLVGVVLAVPSRYGPGRLDAVRITRLLADPTFAGLVGTALDQVEREPPQLLPSGIIEHAEALTELADNLRDDRLAYVPPADPQAPTHPARLLDRLDELTGQCGLLLVGQAGIGKTRTCLEVAGQAVDAGWRVLHVRPGEPLVTTEHLIEVVTGATDDRLLIIIDYLNLSALDYPAIRHRLLPAARARGIRLALLGSARPGWFHQKDNSTLTEVFKPVELRPDDEHLDRIRDQIVTTLAPKARVILGDERLLQLCGRRPVIATLIAAAAEAQADRGRLSAATGDLRPENLLDWLVRRLNEDDLLHHAERLDDERDPDPRLQIYAAMAAATPQPRPALIACGARVEDSGAERAEHLLDVLLAMGWMITTPDGLAPVHDIVVDQLLEHTTVRAGLDTVRTRVADRILDASLTSARTVGRYAMNLDRLLRDMALQGRDGPLAAHCATWLVANATAAGALLAAPQDEGAYALGAVLDNPPWAQSLFQHWPQLGKPWLDRHGVSMPARHLLYKGLRTVATPQAAQLIEVATAWLAQHRTALEASFVVTPLLNRDDLPPADARHGIDSALHWLDQHGGLPEAQFVLHALLDRTDLPPAQTPSAIGHALRWLDRHNDLPDAQFVLHPLLGRTDSSPDDARHAVTAALQWLDQHNDGAKAGFVLSPLLGRTQLTPDDTQHVVTAALRWLDQNIDSRAAQFVLAPLLDRAGLPAEDARHGIDSAVRWLDQHGDRPEAMFVLRPLLGRSDLRPDDVQYLTTAALRWLDRHRQLPEAGFVLPPLLGHAGLPAEAMAHAVDAALGWLQKHGDTNDAGFVLPRLLAIRKLADLPEWLSPLVDRWADRHRAAPDVVFVSKYLARQNALTEVTADVVLQWAAEHPLDVDIPWRLTGVVRGFFRYPGLAGRLLRSVEVYLDGVEGTRAGVNENGELDGLIQALCRSTEVRCGLAGARLDDIVLRWLAHPAALSPNCPPGMEFSNVVSRASSLVRLGRYARRDAVDVLTRLHVWISHWHPAAPHLPLRDAARDDVAALLAELSVAGGAESNKTSGAALLA
ncbi:serine protease family protein [Micromonospora radicis]|uniref:Serine protease n=1 Tax=Micromonospora radicis TaxID=1894971 RepID=A0A418MYX1_9ACTN|nr:serine protease [Micromonospora radicis]RIV39942.1 serine protease [Micromonospora radicis]